MKAFLHSTRFLSVLVLFLIAAKTKAQVHADFSSDVVSGCSPVLVNFKDESNGTDDNTEYYWDLGNGASPSREKNPSALFLNSGSGSVTYTVKLVIKTLQGSDSIVKKSYITVYASPKVDIKTNLTQGCPPLKVQFTNDSKAGSGTIDSLIWDLGEGRLTSVQNPTNTYQYSSNYKISLTVINSFGCKQSSDGSTIIKVLDTVKAGFDYSYTNACQSPAPIDFNNTSQSNTSLSTYNWNFGDGQVSTVLSPNHTYQKPGSYKVQLIAKNTAGCADTIVEQLTIGKVGADFGYDNACTNSAVQFTDSSSTLPVSSVWNFGDGTTSKLRNPFHTYTTPGTYSVTLEADFGSCKGTITKKVVIADRPKAAFSASSSEVCKLPYGVTFTNTTNGAQLYLWEFGDNKTATEKNTSHTYTQEGFYDVTLIASSAAGKCSDTLVVKDAVKLGPPQIEALQGLPAKGCVPLVVSPVAVIKTAEPVVKYIWNFGDGTTSNLAAPQHAYSTPGVYNVSLIAVTAGGCSDTFTIEKAVRTGVAPKPAFSAEPRNVCARISVKFADATGGEVTNWLWKFGDGSQSNLQNPLHHYQDTGWFPVQLVVSNNECKDSITIEDYVYIKPPVAKYQSSFNCAKPFERVFTDRSKGANTWQWEFGDGTISNEQNPVHTFEKTGVYIVKLKVTNDECYDSIQVKMQVVDEHPDFTYDFLNKAACRNDVVTFTTTNVTAANISSYNWVWGDNTASGFNAGYAKASHKYATTGTVVPQLITKDILGCADTVVSKVNLLVYGPKASFATDSGLCINGTAIFADSTKTDGIHAISKWVWTYEKSVSQTYTSASTYTHKYTAEGYYDVKLAVYDNFGCKDSITRAKVLQVTNPKASFSVTDSLKCVKNNISFSNGSKGEKLVYNWNFGDNQTSSSSAASVSHAYTAEGVYTVSLSITDKFQCKSDTVRKNLITISNPKAVMSINGPTASTCPPLIVKPTSKSVGYTSLSWNFNDGSIANIDSPSHVYNLGGQYDLQLVVKGNGECYDTAHQLISVKGPSGKLIYNPFVQCSPSKVSFSCETKDAVKVTWDFNDGVVEPDDMSHATSHVYKNNGKYLPKLLLTDKDGCFVGIENLDTIYVTGAKAAFEATAKASCDSSLTAFTETSATFYDNIKTYQWNFGDGYSSTVRNPQHYYKTSGTYHAKLSLVTDAGCKDSVDIPVQVTVNKSPVIAISAADSTCASSAVAFTGTDTLNEAGSTWSWTFAANQTATGSKTINTFSEAGVYNVKLLVTTPNGCTDTASHALNVIATPKVSAGLDSFVCSGGTIMLKATGATTYHWNDNSTLSCTGCATPIAAPTANTAYVVTGTNGFGCQGTDTIALTVVNKQTIYTKSDTLCAGSNATLSVSGADTYSWTPALYLDNPRSAAPVFHASKDTTITYTVTGADSKNCFSDSKTLTVKVYPVPTIEVSQNDIYLNVGYSVPLKIKSSADVTQWRWEPQAFLSNARVESPIASPKQDITYTCVASNNGSCFARDQISIHVMCNGANMFIPNTFSPNHDGVNDRFFPRGKGVFNVKSMRLYNRWGQVVYEKNSFLPNVESDGWDGTFNGVPLTSDVYVYMIEVICDNNTVLPFKGNVTLVR